MKLFKQTAVIRFANIMSDPDSTLSRFLKGKDTIDLDANRYCSVVTGDDMEDAQGLMIKSPSLELKPDSSSDASNAKLIHDWLRPITRVQANDPRLWTTLSMVTFLDYTRQRWNIDSEKSASSVKDRFLFEGYSLRTRAHNSIARLWWTAELCAEFGEKEGAELLELTFADQDVFSGLFERRISRIATIRRLLPRYCFDANGNKRFAERGLRFFPKELTAWSASTPMSLINDPELCWSLFEQIEDLHFQGDEYEALRSTRPEFPRYLFDSDYSAREVTEYPLVAEEEASSISPDIDSGRLEIRPFEITEDLEATYFQMLSADSGSMTLGVIPNDIVRHLRNLVEDNGSPDQGIIGFDGKLLGESFGINPMEENETWDLSSVCDEVPKEGVLTLSKRRGQPITLGVQGKHQIAPIWREVLQEKRALLIPFGELPIHCSEDQTYSVFICKIKDGANVGGRFKKVVWWSLDAVHDSLAKGKLSALSSDEMAVWKKFCDGVSSRDRVLRGVAGTDLSVKVFQQLVEQRGLMKQLVSTKRVLVERFVSGEI